MNDVTEAIRATNRSPFEAVFESKMIVLQNPISKLMLEKDDSYSLLPSSSPKEGLGSSTMKTISADTLTTAKLHKTTKKDSAANDEQHQESYVSEGKTNSCIIINDLQQGITKGKDSQADDGKAENDHQTQQDVVVGVVAAAPKVSPLCKMGCGFFVSDATGNYCSRCSPLNGEPVDRKPPKAPAPCKAGCGFFGSSETGDYCSKCWMEMKQQQDRLLKQESAPLSILTDDTDDDPLQEDGEENSLNDELRKYQLNQHENDDDDDDDEGEDEDDDSNSKKKDGEMSALEMVRKGTVAVVGGTLVGLGVVLVALPIPLGVPVTCGGLAVLGTEFDEAREMNEALIQETKDKLANARDHAIRTIENMESNCCSSSDDESNNNDKEIESSLSSSSYDTCYEDDEDDDWPINPDEITKFETMMKTKYQKFPKEEDIRQTRSWSVAKSTSSFLSKNVLPILKRAKLGDEESTSSENDDHENEDASPHADSQQPTSDSSSSSSSSSKNVSDDATIPEPPPTSSINGRDALEEEEEEEEEEQESPIEEAVLIARPDVDDCDNLRGCFRKNSGGDCSAMEVMVIESST